jgi:Zn-finger nucleic acid-binding protein
MPEPDSGLFCPVCTGPRLLPLGMKGPDAVWRCVSCRGLWASADAVARAPHRYGIGHPVLAVSLALPRCRSCRRANSAASCSHCGAEQLIKCVQCRHFMERVSVETLVIDICRHCRCAWFDPGEMGTLVAFHRRSLPTTARTAGRSSASWLDAADASALFDPSLFQAGADLSSAAAEVAVGLPHAAASGGEAAISVVEIAGEAAIEGSVAIGEIALDVVGGIFEAF